MTGAVSASTLATVVGGIALQQMLQPKLPDAPKIPTPEKPPQAAQAPDEAARRQTRAAQATAAGGATMLTGNQGIAASTLNLGKNQLLGQ